jgi:hypothetical protein
MRGVTLIGVLLVAIGLAAVLLGHFSYSDTKPLLKAGPLQVNTTEQHDVDIPLIGGIVILLAGVGLIIAGQRAA